MALTIQHKEVKFGVGDVVRVTLKIKEETKSKKTRSQIFEGIVMGIKGRSEAKTFVVRKIGAQKVGIEMIFPIENPNIEKIEVVRKGVEGVKQAKLYYIREKSSREIETIYSRASHKNQEEKSKKKRTVKKETVKKSSKK